MTVLTIATWNMHQTQASWDHLARLSDDHGVQIALLQEAALPAEPERWSFITPDPAEARFWRISVPPKVTRRNYASAIVSLDDHLSLTSVSSTPLAEAGYDTFAACHPGQFAVARVRLPDTTREVVLISLYGLWHMPSGNGAEATLHRAISDLTPLLLSEKSIVVAGDLNLFRNTNNVGQSRFNTVFTRLEAYGLQLSGPFRRPGFPAQVGCTCGQGDKCDHVETFRIWNRNAKPYQDDYVFASSSLGLVSCEVLIDPAVTDYSDRRQRSSDHWPVVARFECS